MPPDRLLPSAHDSETALLCLAVLEPSFVTSLQAETRPTDFTGQHRPRLREMILELVPRLGKITFTLLESEWKRLELPAEGLREIASMRSCSTVFEHVAYNLERIRSTAMRRAVIVASERLGTAAGNGEPDEEVLANLSDLQEIGTRHAATADLIRSGDELTRMVRSDRWAERETTVDLRMGSRFEGIRAGEVFTLLARTWVGKSLWASQAALNCHALVLIVSLEMPAIQWWERTLAQSWGVSVGEARDAASYGRMTPEQAGQAAEAEKRITITDRCDGTMPSIQAAFLRAESRWHHPPRLVVIDHLQFVRPLSARRSRYETVSELALEIKQFARRNRCAVLLVCQVGRAEGADGSTEIGLESARDSGQIEEAADYLLGLWRPSHRKGLDDEQRKARETEMRGRLLKHRRGRSFAWNFRLEPRGLRIIPEETT